MAPTKKKVPQKNTMKKYLTASPSNLFYKQKLSTTLEHSKTIADNLSTTLKLNTNLVNSNNISEHEEMPATSTAVNKAAVEHSKTVADNLITTLELNTLPVNSNNIIEHEEMSATSTAVNKETDGNKRENENKKLIKLTVHQAQRIAKLEYKLERTEKEKSLSKISSCLSEAEFYQLQNLPNDKKWDTKFIRICLESLYKDEPDKLTSMTLNGTKPSVRRGKFYPAKSAINKEKYRNTSYIVSTKR